MAHRRRIVFSLVVAAGLLVAAGVVGAVLALGSGHESGRTNASPVKFSSVQQVRLENGLTAPGIAAQSKVVATEIRAQFLSRAQPLLPSGSHARVGPATFDLRSAKTATVDATVTGPEPGHWQLLLIREGGNWLLIGTRRLP
jgi:hypothetical protein